MAHHDSSQQIESGREGVFLGLSLALGLLLTAFLFGSIPDALLFAAALIAFVAPGVVLARRWLEGPEAVLAGSALGYFLGSLAASVLVRLSKPSPGLLLAASAASFLLVWTLAKLVRRRRRPGRRGEKEPGSPSPSSSLSSSSPSRSPKWAPGFQTALPSGPTSAPT